ncbi:hypothetical protein SEA_SCHMIDT_1 [Gordonia phage Schmidt]|uniref:Uncharacterized protein n=1 Tax=Gordonia phage Schmidt TaxID=2301697 RepID=A0A385E031_9CAUD|nr:hypothetical protein KDJ59_gp01 [Gordonia phage Schmidt]AXQ65123.1 hypothetical protein SEA_SCHMIDT_1 [Gordonia phage Schmidt]
MNSTATYPCTCNSLQYGSAGSYTWSLLGVNCPGCEAAMHAEEAQAEWDAMAPAERIASRWKSAQLRIESGRWRRNCPAPSMATYAPNCGLPF